MNIMFIASDDCATSGAFLSMVRLTTILQEKYHHNILVVLPRGLRNKRGPLIPGKPLLDKNKIRNTVVPSYTWTAGKNDKGVYYPKQLIKVLIGGIVRFYSVPQISKLIQKESIDLIHINTSWTYVGALAALRTGVPFIWHIREFLEEDQSRQIVNKQRGYKLMKKADRVVAISDSIQKKYTPILGADKVVTILNGIDPGEFLDITHKIFCGKIVNMIIVGAVNENKGQWIAIEACSKLLERGITHFRLRIIGNGPKSYLQHLQEKVQDLNLSEYVEFCGPTSNITQYYKTTDIALVCSKAEAFGRVTVEAMLGGALLIGADSAGTHDMVVDGETGLLFENENPEKLAEKLVCAFENPTEMQAVAKKGQQYMRDNMTAEINAEKINSLYEEIMRGKD